jgi:hypothetical protein
MNTRYLFNASAGIEGLTGLALLAGPLFVIGLLLGDGLAPTGVAVARILGIGLLSVGVAGWESRGQEMRHGPRIGLCIYNVGATILFVTLGTYGGMNGILLWPAAVLHGLIGAMMLWAMLAPWKTKS